MLAVVSTSFVSSGQRCAAWITRPPQRTQQRSPGIVLVHGLGATHEMALHRYEAAFAAAGFVVLSFDFGHIGASSGEPRQLISLRRQLTDVEAAVDTLAADGDVDPRRIGLWGTSLGATHAIITAARRTDIGAVVVQCPVVNGANAGLRSGWLAAGRLLAPLLSDVGRAAFGRDRRYVAIVGNPGDRAMVTVPGAKQGWESLIPPGYVFDNRIAAAAGIELIVSNAARRARQVRAPLLVCVSDRETLMKPSLAVKAAERAPRGRAVHYDADHFEVYHPPLLERIVGDQIAFFTEHLGHE